MTTTWQSMRTKLLAYNEEIQNFNSLRLPIEREELPKAIEKVDAEIKRAQKILESLQSLSENLKEWSAHTTKVSYGILGFQYPWQTERRLGSHTYPTIEEAREYVKGYVDANPKAIKPEIWKLSGGKWEKVE